MLRRQAFQFALRPNGEQLRNLRQFAGSCRFVYNKALALNVERYEKKEKPEEDYLSGLLRVCGRAGLTDRT